MANEPHRPDIEGIEIDLNLMRKMEIKEETYENMHELIIGNCRNLTKISR